MQTLTWARDAVQPHPGSRECLDGQVLVAAGYEDGARWREGDRLEHVFEDRCDELREQGQADRLAVDAGDVTLTYAELDARANRLARFLVRRGVRPGDRIGLLFDEAVDSYAGHAGGAEGARGVRAAGCGLSRRTGWRSSRPTLGLRLVLTHSRLAHQAESLAAATEVLPVDQARAQIMAEPTGRLGPDEAGAAADDLCYVIYTSGTTGRPKGVAISHASICNFVRVAAEVYGITGGDRVYQGMTIAFDFSVEEIWVPWAAGATLVPKPGRHLLGPDLDAFLRDRADHRRCAVCRRCWPRWKQTIPGCGSCWCRGNRARRT